MIITSLTLQNFRSYTKQVFKFSPETTLITGINTAGKTNLLESIFMLATGKSFRADQDREVVRWGSEVSRVIAVVAGENLDPSSEVASRRLSEAGQNFAGSTQSRFTGKLELVLTNGIVQSQQAPLKKHLVNGIPRRSLDFIGNLRAVLFWPEDLELVTDSPSLRRKYLDNVLVQADREYRRNLLSYERGTRQRNRLLDLIRDGKAHRHQLDFWNELLIRAGGYLTDSRTEYIDFVNNFRSAIKNYQLFYDKSVISESRLLQYKDEEVMAGATLVGPHRDDIIFKLNGMELSKYGSRGEQRLAILWLKLAELDFIEDKTSDRPMLLLDDIFSELDENHRDLVLQLTGRQQTILTSADEEILHLLRKNKKTQVVHLPARS